MDSQTKQAKQQQSKPHWLINRNYRFLFFGQAISLLGDQLSTFTIILWIVTIIAPGQSWGPLAISAVLTASLVPNLLIGPLAGVFVDRWNPKMTMIRMDIIRAFLTLLLVASTGVIPLPFLVHGRLPQLAQLIVICVLTFLSSTCAQFFTPSYMGLIATIVSKEQRPQSASLGQTMQAFAAIVGPPLAAPLLYTFGIKWALLLDALSFIVSFLTISAIQSSSKATGHSEQSSFWREFKEGIYFSFSNTTVRTIVTTSFIATLGAGAFDALYVFFLTGNLHTSASFTGIIATALGIGTIGGAFLASKIVPFLKLEHLLIYSLLGIGLCLVVISRLTYFAPALILFLVFGIFLASLRVASGPLLMNETPQTMLGRVFAVLGPTSALASLFSALLSGFLASVLLVNLHSHFLGMTFGPIDTIFVGVGILFLLSALYASSALSKKVAQVEPVSMPEQPQEVYE